MRWLKQSEIAPPLDMWVLVRGGWNHAQAQIGCWASTGKSHQWEGIHENPLFTYDKSRPQMAKTYPGNIEWAPLPGQLLPMHCLKPEMSKVLVFMKHAGMLGPDKWWWNDNSKDWEDSEDDVQVPRPNHLGFLIIPTDAAELTVLDIPEGDTK